MTPYAEMEEIILIIVVSLLSKHSAVHVSRSRRPIHLYMRLPIVFQCHNVTTQITVQELVTLLHVYWNDFGMLGRRFGVKGLGAGKILINI